MKFLIKFILIKIFKKYTIIIIIIIIIISVKQM